MKKRFNDKRVIFFYIIVIFALILGFTYALGSNSLAFNVDTAIVAVDETAYGDTTFDTSELDFKPILDSAVETSSDNVIKIDFTVGGASENNNDNIIYDIALVDLDVNCNLLSSYIKWKLVKNGEEISTGSLDYKFDTIVNGRLVLTTVQQDLADYSTDQTGYDDYTFYMWFSDSCQSDLSTCISNNQIADQSKLIGQNLSGKIEVELYTEGKKELVRKPSNTLNTATCNGTSYSLFFDYQGGVGTDTSKNIVTGSTYGELPTPTRDGYTFNGWYTKPNGDGNKITESTSVDQPSNLTIYAYWKLIEDATVTFDPNDGTVSTTTKIVSLGKTYGELPTPTRTGYTFDGWYTEINGGGSKITENTTVTNTSEHTLYAKWTANTYNVSFNDNMVNIYNKTLNGITITYDKTNSYLTLNGTVSGTQTNLMFYEELYFTANDQYQITLEHISGSFTNSDSYSLAAELKKDNNGGLSTRNYADVGFPTSNGITSNILTISSVGANEGTALSVWIWCNTANTLTFTNYKVKINITKVETKTVTYGSTYGDLPTPTRGVRFDGWYTEPNGGGTKITSTSQVTTSSNHTLYAKWTSGTYALIVNPNGGTYNGTTLNSIFIQGYDSVKNVGSPTAPSGYTVTFNGNGGTAGSASLTSTKSFSGWTKSGTGLYVASTSPTTSGMSRTSVTESGESFDRFNYSVSGLTSSTWYNFHYGTYTYTADDTYDIRFKLRVNSFVGDYFCFRPSAFYNDWGSTGSKNYCISANNVSSKWKAILLTRTFTGTTISFNGSDKTIAPVFEGYTADLKETTSSTSFDVKDLVIINKSKDTLLKSNTNAFVFRAGDGTLTANYTNGSITLPNATRTGHSFLGWSTSSTATSATYASGSTYTPTANTTLYAVWKADTYTVSYNANGGTGAPGAQTKTYGDNLTLSSTKPTRLGYQFLGWSTSSTATSATYAAGGTYSTNASTTLYAVWRTSKVYIKYSVNGGTITSSTTASDGTVYTWTTDSSGLIYRSTNGGTSSVLRTVINYGATTNSNGLLDWDNTAYTNITRTQHYVKTGSEWKCLSGCTTSGKVFSDSKAYAASDFCDASYGDCTVVLGINWVADSTAPVCNITKVTCASKTSAGNSAIGKFEVSCNEPIKKWYTTFGYQGLDTNTITKTYTSQTTKTYTYYFRGSNGIYTLSKFDYYFIDFAGNKTATKTIDSISSSSIESGSKVTKGTGYIKFPKSCPLG